MTSLKTRIARLGKTPSPARPITRQGQNVPHSAYQYTATPAGAELVPLAPVITSDGAIVAGAGPGGPDTLAPAGRPG
jgi:hypothetical protein